MCHYNYSLDNLLILTLNVYQLPSETIIEDFNRNAFFTVLLTLNHQFILRQPGGSLPLTFLLYQVQFQPPNRIARHRCSWILTIIYTPKYITREKSKELAANGTLRATFHKVKIPTAYMNRTGRIKESIISPRAKDVLPTGVYRL